MATAQYKFKVCLVGEHRVGKSSVIRRFVTDQYSDEYISTIGVKASKKELRLVGAQGDPFTVDMIIWDIMGARSLRHLLQEAYFNGAEGILGVSDLTRNFTLLELGGWIKGAMSQAGQVPTVVVGNKVDLEDEISIGEEDFLDFCRKYKATYMLTSAKTGYNVQEAFVSLARAIMANLPNQGRARSKVRA